MNQRKYTHHLAANSQLFAYSCTNRPRFSGLHPIDASICYLCHQSEWALTKSCQLLLSATSESTWTLMYNEVARLKDCSFLICDSASTAEYPYSSLSSVLRSTVTGFVSFCSGWTTVTQRWLAFYPISPSGCSRCLILLLGLCFLHRVTTVSRHSWHSCTGWRCRIASSLSWLFWYTDACTRHCRHTMLRNFISHVLTRLVSVSALPRHHRLLSHAPVFQPSANELFQWFLPYCGAFCRWTSRQHRQCLSSDNVWRPISSVILSLNLL